MHHLLRTLPSILVLPDSENHTLALGYRIKANFQFSFDTPHDNILSIAEQLLNKTNHVTTINSLRNQKHQDNLSIHQISNHDKVSNF